MTREKIKKRDEVGKVGDLCGFENGTRLSTTHKGEQNVNILLE